MARNTGTLGDDETKSSPNIKRAVRLLEVYRSLRASSFAPAKGKTGLSLGCDWLIDMEIKTKRALPEIRDYMVYLGVAAKSPWSQPYDLLERLGEAYKFLDTNGAYASLFGALRHKDKKEHDSEPLSIVKEDTEMEAGGYPSASDMASPTDASDLVETALEGDGE